MKDHQADSYHESNPDLPSSGDEHRLSNRAIKPLFRLFPTADVLESNHGALPNRKLKTAQLSKEYIKSEKERISAPKGWHFHTKLVIKTESGPILIIHGNKRTANLFLYAQKIGMSVMQGHYHSKFEIQYWNTGSGPKFSLTSGCLINDSSAAFEYNKDDVLRPIYGVTFLINGIPQLIPMILNKRGRWIGKL